MRLGFNAWHDSLDSTDVAENLTVLCEKHAHPSEAISVGAAKADARRRHLVAGNLPSKAGP